MLDYCHAHREIEPRWSEQRSPGNRNYKFSFPISLTSKTVEKSQGNSPCLVSQAQGARARSECFQDFQRVQILTIEWLYWLRSAKLCALWTAQAFICANSLAPVLRRVCRVQTRRKIVLLRRVSAFHFLRRNSYSSVPLVYQLSP